MEKLLKLLSNNARFTDEQLAVMMSTSVEDIKNQISDYEKAGIIKGYTTIIDYTKLDEERVTAFIELKVNPKRDLGFDEICQRVMQFDEVASVFLMSGGYDLHVKVIGKTFHEVAMFVAQRLSPLDSVVSTATHFVLQKYKENGVSFIDNVVDERGNASL